MSVAHQVKFVVPASAGFLRLKAGLRTRRDHLRLIVLASAACLIVCTFGCTGSDVGDTEESEKKQVARTEIERGPVHVIVEVEPNPARLSDEPKLTLTIDYEQGVEVDKPPFGEAVGDSLQIRDYHEPLPEAKEGREIIRQVYTLEPTRTGELQIDPIAVTFIVDGKKHTVETEALAIEVTSMIGEEAPSLDDLRGIEGPVELPEPRGMAMWLVAIGCGLAVAVAASTWVLLRRRKYEPEKQFTPQELAFLELQRIVQQELSDRDVKLYYVELTGVVRRYVERTTGVHAPEQTTEEFLREISSAEVFSGDEQDRLRSFLESADLVKFAAHQPAAHDIEESFRRAKVFIGLEAQEAVT